MESLLKPSSFSRVVHHAGVAVMTDFKKVNTKQMDIVKQENKEVDMKVQNSNFCLVVGVLQLLLKSTQFDFCTSRIFHWKCT